MKDVESAKGSHGLLGNAPRVRGLGNVPCHQKCFSFLALNCLNSLAALLRVHIRHRHGRPLAREGERRGPARSEEHTSELQSLAYLVCRLLLEKKKTDIILTSDALRPASWRST